MSITSTINSIDSLEERVKRVVQEEVVIVPYNPDWPKMFEEEKDHLTSCLPHECIKRRHLPNEGLLQQEQG